MPITRLFKQNCLDGTVIKTNDVALFSTTGQIAVQSTTFSVEDVDLQGDNILSSPTVTFSNIAAGLVISHYQVRRGTAALLLYVDNEPINGTVGDRTIGPAGGQVTLQINLELN